ncbi:hypothetical protein VHUM_04182 [Vanrija humicola]|uniref:Enoyl-CoA hydratase n=1 Tax=Vanrija humicola TaxID=5417 RepID=A0A7D8UW47_VANHU|nr:hypothetical protein VHUM_04182 [Vanrija humicola]
MPAFKTSPPDAPEAVLSFPAPHILHVAMNRPKNYNAMNGALNAALEAAFAWFDSEPSLYVAILSSTSRKAWCAGADLLQSEGKDWMKTTKNGFGAISTRITKKPIIGAVHGLALGGGSEMIVNLDMVIAGDKAKFGFPEVKRGVWIGLGGLPRFVKLVGHQKATELILTGRNISPAEALALNMVNYVVPDDEVEARALALAQEIAENSPDSVVAQLYAIRLTHENTSSFAAQRLIVDSAPIKALEEGENILEGLVAFKEKRKPNWVPSKL